MVLSLATRAFRDLPEEHMYQQAVLRLCQGAADKEAGSAASNIRPKSIEEAVDTIRWHIHNKRAIYGKHYRGEIRQVKSGPSFSGSCSDGEGAVWKADLAAVDGRIDKLEQCLSSVLGEIKGLNAIRVSRVGRPSSVGRELDRGKKICEVCPKINSHKSSALSERQGTSVSTCLQYDQSRQIESDCTKPQGKERPLTNSGQTKGCKGQLNGEGTA